MSDYERNKGKLVPFNGTVEDLNNMFNKEIGIDDLPYDTGGMYAIVNDKIYQVQWEIRREDDVPEFADVKVNEDGSIDFHTYHYNGGGYWTEVVEGALEEDNV